MKKLILLVLLALALGLLPVAGHATTTMYSDRSVWQTALGIPVTDVAIPFTTGFTNVTAGSVISLPVGSVSFDQLTQCAQVGPDPVTQWTTWSNGNTPKILYTNGLTTVTATFTVGQWAFGLEMEPNNQIGESMTLDLGGGNFLTQNVNGNGGAKFFGWISDVGYTSMRLTDNATDFPPNDFAIGRMAAVPVPPSVLLLGSGLAGLGLWRGRKRFMS